MVLVPFSCLYFVIPSGLLVVILCLVLEPNSVMEDPRECSPWREDPEECSEGRPCLLVGWVCLALSESCFRDYLSRELFLHVGV